MQRHAVGALNAMVFVFFLSLGLLVFVYIGFPALLGLVARLGRVHTEDREYRPCVTVLVAAHEEASVIGAKLENFLALDYPPERLSMVVVSDGSTDGTDDIVRAFHSPRIELLRQEPRQGKAAALALGLAHIEGDVVVLTDANVMFAADAVKELVKDLADAEVGVVTGEVKLLDKKRGYASSEGAYYKYERFIQASESRLWSVVGVDGALYAARRELIDAPPANAILDDFVLSMGVAAKGFRIVYEPAAIAHEDAPPSIADEFRRKVRTSAGAFQALRNGWGLPNRNARLIVCFVCHKVLRWAAPWFMVSTLVANALLAAQGPVWALMLCAQLLFYAAGLAGLAYPALRGLKIVSIPMYFILMNAAVGYGLIRNLVGQSSAHWTPTARTQIDSPRV